MRLAASAQARAYKGLHYGWESIWDDMGISRIHANPRRKEDFHALSLKLNPCGMVHALSHAMDFHLQPDFLALWKLLARTRASLLGHKLTSTRSGMHGCLPTGGFVVPGNGGVYFQDARFRVRGKKTDHLSDAPFQRQARVVFFCVCTSYICMYM